MLTWQAVHALIGEVDEQMVPGLHRMCVCLRVWPSSLVKLAAHQAAVHILQGDASGAADSEYTPRQHLTTTVTNTTRKTLKRRWTDLVGEGDTANTLKIKVEQWALDGVHVRAASAPRILSPCTTTTAASAAASAAAGCCSIGGSIGPASASSTSSCRG